MVRLGTEAEVLHMFTALEGKVVEVAGGWRIVIEVMPHISLVERARNCRVPGDGGGGNYKRSMDTWNSEGRANGNCSGISAISSGRWRHRGAGRRALRASDNPWGLHDGCA